ncbi:MAG: hypothetical protein ABI625_05860 [bacterium]
MKHTLNTPLARVALAVVVAFNLSACNKSDHETVDSAAGTAALPMNNLSVRDVDLGKHIDSTKKIVDRTDDFAPTDTIYAAVQTTGTATNTPIVGRWTFEDGTVVDERTDAVSTSGDASTVFFISKPGGFAPGKYTLHVLVNGNEVSSKDAKVK